MKEELIKNILFGKPKSDIAKLYDDKPEDKVDSKINSKDDTYSGKDSDFKTDVDKKDTDNKS